MSPGSYSDVFGGNNIAPSQPSYLLIDPLTANILLNWPIEQSMAGSLVVADIIDVNPTSGGHSIQLSSAEEVSTGYTALFNNVGANTFTVLDNAGGVIASIASGTVWQIYLIDNTTVAGTWRIFQFGAGTSSANAAALAGAGLIAITTTLNENMVVKPEAADYVSTTADRAVVIEWTGGTGNITLPTAGGTTAPSGWFVIVKNEGSGIVTVAPPTGTIDQVASLPFAPDESAFIVTDGTNYFTIGFGKQINSIFDFIQIDITGGTGNIVLTGAQLNRISYRFTGAIAGNVNIIVPNTIQQYWIDNETTGNFSLTTKTAAGTGIAVGQGSRNILYSDGVNVTNAVTFGSTGFTNGTAASPSIFFTASPHSGLFSPGADRISLSTNGSSRLDVDATGHFHVEQPDNNSAAAFWIEGNLIPGTQSALRVTSASSTAVAPMVSMVAQGAGGFSILEIMGGQVGNVLGTNDLAIFQDGSNTASILNRDPVGNLNIGAGGHQTAFVMDHFGQITLNPAGGVALLINGAPSNTNIKSIANAAAGSLAAWFVGQAPGAPAIEVDNSIATGSQSANFTGVTNKPGATGGVSPTTWLPISAAGTTYYIPLWL